MRISIPTLLVALASIISAFSEPKNGLQTAKFALGRRQDTVCNDFSCTVDSDCYAQRCGACILPSDDGDEDGGFFRQKRQDVVGFCDCAVEGCR
ncbi:hypothetical protein KCU81_g8885, partial [Aureobasidium melanogenum]|uniref:Uncharacterized protein n=1 Tax=Aureobasidium melanogenum (strain CBS 110374) TaxID=1043003 RepID=A0A074VKL3_AURM1